MIYCLGLRSEIKDIQQNLDEQLVFHHVDDLSSITDLNKADLFLIGPSIEKPIRHVQQMVAKDSLLSVVILVGSATYNQTKQSLLFSMDVGRNALCVVFNPSANYSSVFQNAILRTHQKRTFSKFNAATEKKLAALTSPNAKLSNLGHILEHAPIGAILVNSHLDVIGANKAARKMFSQLDGNPLPLEIIFPRNYHEIINRIQVSDIEKTFIVEEGRGSCFEISTSSVPAEDGDKRILLINDVTGRREKARRISAVLESLPHIAWTADAEGNIDYYNHGWYNYTNRDASEGLGDGWISIIHPDDLGLLASRWNESVKEGKAFQHAARFRRFDGVYRWHLSMGTPIFNHDKTVDMWVGTSTDIHDQVMLKEELERKVTERTKLLEEANEELEQFAHISSHDLQEPLRKIQTFAHMVRDDDHGQFTDQARRYLEKIITTSSRMSKLIKDLLSYSKINQHEPESILSLNSVVQQIQEDLELAIAQTGAVINTDILPSIKARPLQIRQLFYNIISNSIKYKKPDAAPFITIKCAVLGNETRQRFKNLTDAEYWEIVVADNGIGFEQKYADQIFTVFQRLHNRSAYDGTGIGLAIANKVVTNHRGEIFAVSSPGNGAEFHIILPATNG